MLPHVPNCSDEQRKNYVTNLAINFRPIWGRYNYLLVFLCLVNWVWVFYFSWLFNVPINC